GRRRGGLWSAAGTLGAGAGDSVRLALLAIVFASAGLPTHYDEARFVIWLKQEGHYDAFERHLRDAGRDIAHELQNMYISPFIAQALIDTVPGVAATPLEARELLRTQYYMRASDISDDDFVEALRDVL